ncbi:MOSC domain-containing protein [Hypoxylon sp. FL1150]|nr:MOSC domain-containing protein [Hypoxylon sp. FL1150]
MRTRDMSIKITELYIYPIKSLRLMSVRSTRLLREGLQHDRRFMLLKAEANGRHTNVQISKFPECALFAQALDGDYVVVTYQTLEADHEYAGQKELRVPLDPAVEDLQANGTVDILLFGSATSALRVGDEYDAWFSARLGYLAVLVYIGDSRRSVLAHAPPPPPVPKSWFSSVTSFLPSYLYQQSPQGKGEEEKLVFNEVAPFLLTSRASLRDVEARMMPGGEGVDMIKFRPNIVVDEVPSPSSIPPSAAATTAPTPDDRDNHEPILSPWDEDFWGEIAVGPSRHRLALTANCARCVSVDIDYATGKRTDVVLKRLMRDRRVDAGNKWSPIFGRYSFLLLPSSSMGGDSSGRDEETGIEDEAALLAADVAVGDEVEVTRRLDERDVWAWPK